MSDEAIKQETVVAETKVVEQPVVNPVEDQAREQGWVSKEEWVKDGRDANEWRPAKEFVERGELFKSIHQIKRELKQTKAAHDALTQHHKYVFEKAYTKALNDLKLEKRQAMRNEDMAKVVEVEEKIEALTEEKEQEAQRFQQQQVQAAAANNVQPAFQEWVSRNQWYTTDSEMREFAEAVGHIYMQKTPGFTPEDVLKHVEAKVRKQYSEKFGQRKAAPNAVAGVDRTGKRSGGVELILDETEMAIMKTLVQNGDMTEDEYKAELKKAKGL